MVSFCRGCLGLLQFGLCSYRSGVLLMEQHRDKPRLPEGKLEPTQSIFHAQSDPSLSPVPCPAEGMGFSWADFRGCQPNSHVTQWHWFHWDLVLDNWAPRPSFHHPTAQIAAGRAAAQAGLKWLWVKGVRSGWGWGRSLQPPINVQCSICWHLRQQRRFLSEFSH